MLVLIVILVAMMLIRKGVSSSDVSKLEESLRQELARQQSSRSSEARALREEVVKLLRELSESITGITRSQGLSLQENLGLFSERLDKLTGRLSEGAVQQRREMAEAHARLTDTQGRQLESVRNTLSENLEKMRGENAEKLEEMRLTVDEKLHSTLEKRLGESFEQVSKRLEEVARGLGEMQQLATGVGDLKRVLTNVKARGTWGEYQLEAILAETLTVEQYGRNVKTNPQTNDLVEFAIKLPGRGNSCEPVWLPIDSKFPKEDYERLQVAVENADKPGAEGALRLLERRIRDSAKDIRKYLAPPHTTDFAILFLPTEGLYAEVLRLPGLVDDIQREFRITVAGPTTLTALLNSLQMGFRTLAIEKRSSEVWQVLAAVKSEFIKFGDVFEKVQRKIEDADKILKSAEMRTRAMTRKLRSVEDLPESVSVENVLEE